MKSLVHVALALTVLMSAMAPAKADEAAARQDIHETYTFRPHELTGQQIGDKSGLLDGLWARAKAQAETYIPVLRSELARADAQAFFLYDGSMLLLSLSDSPADRRLALMAMARCDLRDVQPTDYFFQVHRMATLNENTTQAALHILGEPKFAAVIPQHALTLGQDYSLIYMVFPLDPAQWLPNVLARLAVEREPTAQKSLLLLAWYAQDRKADAAIAAFAVDAAQPAANREYALELSSRNAKIVPPAATQTAHQSENSLRAERRELMKRVSDEALIELDEKTAQIVAQRK